MTAYGFGESLQNKTRYSCELKSLNSRFLEVNVRLPRSVMALESEVIALAKELLARGKVDIFLEVVTETDVEELPRLNAVALDHYLRLATTVQERQRQAGLWDAGSALSISHLLRLEGVLESGSRSAGKQDLIEAHRQGILQAVRQAAQSLISMRAAEGARLESVLRDMILEIGKAREAIATETTTIRANVHAQYRKRVESLWQQLKDGGLKVGELPEDRLAFEITVLADKSDIAEEITRMTSHEQDFLEQLSKAEPVGRRLDFLCQEMHREVNTMSNKAVQTSVSHYTMQIKETIERLRQQVQNIE